MGYGHEVLLKRTVIRESHSWQVGGEETSGEEGGGTGDLEKHMECIWMGRRVILVSKESHGAPELRGRLLRRRGALGNIW